jgi:hypothetical protein
MIYPATYNITALRNATVRLDFTIANEDTTPIDLTGYIIDSDIYSPTSETRVESFVTTIIDAANGEFQLSLDPPDTLGLLPGNYSYDVSLTQPGGDRYYWLKGAFIVEETISRND